MTDVAVITVRGDVHVPLVDIHLKRRFIVLDALKLLEDSTCLSVLVSPNSGTKVIYDGIDLSNVKSVWFRKPAFPESSSIPLDIEYRDYAADALERLFYLLYGALRKNVLWISDYYAIQRANDKGWQLEVAKDVGFNIPTTLFTSDSLEAANFITTHRNVIMKPLSSVRIIGDTQPQTMFAVMVQSSKMPRLDTLHVSPLIFQKAIDVAFEIRCTVVGDQVFAAKVVHSKDNKAENNIRDWRIGHFDNNLEITDYDNDMPQDIKNKCIAHVKYLDLHFGAIDMIVDKNNQYWFIENNPNGQWGFIERYTGQLIGKAVADLLQ